MDDKLELHGEWEKRDGGGLGGLEVGAGRGRDWDPIGPQMVRRRPGADGPTGAYWGGSVG